MALNMVVGGSGQGKSRYIYNKIMEQSVKESGVDFLIIVPEQFTMQTQRDIVMLSKAKGIMNIDVLSFMRLAYRVLADTPALAMPVLADEGKGMVIRRILHEHADEWKTFGGNINRPGFVEEIKSIVTEFIQYRTPEDMTDILSSSLEKRRTLGAKLEDLGLVYRYYREYMESRYISAEEILELLVDYAEESKLLNDSVICIDGFTGLTPVQYELLGKLLKVCRDVYITVTIDNKCDIMKDTEPFELFYMSRCYIKRVLDIARNNGVPVADIHYTGRGEDLESWRFGDNPWLGELEKRLFRPGKNSNNIEKLNSDNRSVFMYEAANPYEETEYTVWKIRQLVRNKQIRYGDIAIVTGDMDLYGRLLQQEFDKVNIPSFIDNNKSVMSNSLVCLIRSLLKMVAGGYMYADVIQVLRNGLVRDYLGFATENTDRLENYLIATGLRGPACWSKEWKSRRFDEEELAAVNEYRERVGELILPFGESMAKCNTVLEYSKELYMFLAEHDIDEIIDKKAREYEEAGLRIRQKEYEQIYRIVIDLIDQMAVLMGDEEVSESDYAALLNTGFKEATVGVIPPGIDCIIVGDIERTRLKDIKVLFFLGVNDGIIPKAVKNGGFLSDAEREYLLLQGAELAPTMRERAFNERFYLYLNVTKPSEELYLSYSRKGCQGQDLEPSSFIRQIYDVLGEIDLDTDYRSSYDNAVLGNDVGKTGWINGLRRAVDVKDAFFDKIAGKEDKEWLELHREWMATDEGRRIFDNAIFNGEKSSITERTARLLYGSELKGSISRLELFARCRFAHFLKYGLCLGERPEHVIAVPDIGILFHSVVEEFSKKLDRNKLRWQDTNEGIIESWTREITETVCDEYGDRIIYDTARNEYMKERIYRIACSAINALAGQMKKGSFEAEGYELSFSRIATSDMLNIDLEDGCVMHLSGRIDRLDVCEMDDKVYVKVIDYKTGNKSFDAQNILYGLDMQLVVYLQAAKDVQSSVRPDKLVIPAGAFYFHIDDPVIDDMGNDAANEAAVQSTYVMRGPVNSDRPVACLIDHSLGSLEGELIPGMVSNVVKAVVNTKGTYDMRRSEVVSGRQFGYMNSHVHELIRDFGRRILEGDTAIEPYKLGEDTGCAYCAYSAVCGFDPRLEDNCYRKLDKKSAIEVWEELAAEYGKE